MSGEHQYARNTDELIAALAEQGERVGTAGAATVVKGEVDGIDSIVQIRWRDDLKTVFFLEVLSYLIPPDKTNELIRFNAFANAETILPGFQILKKENGWRVGYSLGAFLDHEGRISSRVALEAVRAVRRGVKAAHPLLQNIVEGTASAPAENTGPADDFNAAEARGAAKHKAIASAPTPVQLTAAERAALTSAFEAKLPRFAGRVAEAEATNVGAPFFDAVRVLRLESAAPFPACEAFAALTPTGALVLSGNPASLEALFAAEKPAQMADPDLALMLGLIAGYWTSASLHNDMRIASVDEIPWRDADADDEARKEAIRTTYGPQIEAPTLERTQGAIRVRSWVVSESWLRTREIEIRHDGARVIEKPVAELPVHPGRMWGDQDGRWVPIG